MTKLYELALCCFFFLLADVLAALIGNRQREPRFSGSFSSSVLWTPVFGIYMYSDTEKSALHRWLHHFELFFQIAGMLYVCRGSVLGVHG